MDRPAPEGVLPKRGRRGRRGYPGLDGIRAVAVLAVMFYHFGVVGMRGGFLGVDVFFVLSGYLITGQLVTRWVLGDDVSLRTFWAARIRRLLPALGALLVGTTTAVVLLDRAQLSLYRGDMTAAATYSSNWWYIFHQRSYFVAAGRPPLLQHLWSLAVEEQFYLVWPLVVVAVVLACRSINMRLRVLTVIAIVIALASSLVMGVGSALTNAPEAADPSRWYFGSDSHVVGLLIGATLAIWRRGDELGSRGLTRRSRLPIRDTVVGSAAFVLLLVLLSRTDEYSVWLYRWGFVAISLLTAVVIAAATRPGPLETLLCRPILRGIGHRSYALYLWHWPVACFTRPGVDLPISNTGALALRLGLTFLLAEMSYVWIEQPVRRHGFRSAWRLVSTSRVGAVRGTTVITAFAAALALGVVMPATASPTIPNYEGGGTVYISHPGKPESLHIGTPGDGSSSAPGGAGATGSPPASSRPTHNGSTTPPGHTTPPGSNHPTDPPTTTPATTTPPPTKPPTGQSQLRSYDLAVYGDSVALGAIPDLASTFRSVTNNATEGIQAWTLLPELTADAHAGRLDGYVVLIHTGDNGVISRSQLASTLGALSKAVRVIVALPYVPREWQSDNHAIIESMAGAYPNVRLMDWETVARAHPEDTWSDGIHLTPSGEQVYAEMVAAAASAP